MHRACAGGGERNWGNERVVREHGTVASRVRWVGCTVPGAAGVLALSLEGPIEPQQCS